MNKILRWKWYFAIVLIYLFTVIFQLDPASDLLRLALLPCIFWYHSRNVDKIHPLVWVIMLSYYFGDILWSLHDPDNYPLMLVTFGVGHLVFMYICYLCIKDLNVKRLLFSAIPFVALWFVYFNYSIKDIFGDQMGDQYPYILGYSIVISAFLIVALIKFFNDEQKIFLYTVIVALTLVFGDIMYSLYIYINPVVIFKLTHGIATCVGYFFIMRFFNEFDLGSLFKSTADSK